MEPATGYNVSLQHWQDQAFGDVKAASNLSSYIMHNSSMSTDPSVVNVMLAGEDYMATGVEQGTALTPASDYPFYPLIKQPVHMIVIYSMAYSVVFLLGLIGNSLVVSVVYRNPRMHNVTNYFIVNLAVADILVLLFCLPMTLLTNLYSGKSNLIILYQEGDPNKY